MKMAKYTAAALFVVLLCAPPPAMAFLQEVHDSVIYVHNTIKAIQDEAYQQMALDIGADQLGTTGEILKTSVDTLKVTKDTFDVCKDTYDTAMDISGYIGDPMKLTSYLNSRFWHENEILQTGQGHLRQPGNFGSRCESGGVQRFPIRQLYRCDPRKVGKNDA